MAIFLFLVFFVVEFLGFLFFSCLPVRLIFPLLSNQLNKQCGEQRWRHRPRTVPVTNVNSKKKTRKKTYKQNNNKKTVSLYFVRNFWNSNFFNEVSFLKNWKLKFRIHLLLLFLKNAWIVFFFFFFQNFLGFFLSYLPIRNSVYIERTIASGILTISSHRSFKRILERKTKAMLWTHIFKHLNRDPKKGRIRGSTIGFIFILYLQYLPDYQNSVHSSLRR